MLLTASNPSSSKNITKADENNRLFFSHRKQFDFEFPFVYSVSNSVILFIIA